jgi:membrane protease YdiL (CAAX protease family)
MIAREWVAALIVLLLWLASGRPWSDLGLEAPAGRRFFIASALTFAATAFLFFQLIPIGRSAAMRADLQTKLSGALAFLPRTDREMTTFGWLALTAGICEEIAFRGFLIWYLAAAFGLPLAAVISAVLFGLAHAYQGRTGIVKTGIVGFVFTGLYLLSGSLWLPIVLHAAVDLSGGLAAQMAFAPLPAPALNPTAPVDQDRS